MTWQRVHERRLEVAMILFALVLDRAGPEHQRKKSNANRLKKKHTSLRSPSLQFWPVNGSLPHPQNSPPVSHHLPTRPASSPESPLYPLDEGAAHSPRCSRRQP